MASDQTDAASAVSLRYYHKEAIMGKGKFDNTTLCRLKGKYSAKSLPVVLVAKSVTSFSNDKQQINVLRNIAKHPNLVELYSVEKNVVLMEWCDCNLNTYLESEGILDRFASFSVQMARGLEYLHNKGVIHGNLKCENVLVVKRWQLAKLSDYGLATNSKQAASGDLPSPLALSTMSQDIFALGQLFPVMSASGGDARMSGLIQRMTGKEARRPSARELLRELQLLCDWNRILGEINEADRGYQQEKKARLLPTHHNGGEKLGTDALTKVTECQAEITEEVRSTRTIEKTRLEGERKAAEEAGQKLREVIATLGLEEFYPGKLELDHVRTHYVKGFPSSMKEVPWYLLNRILFLDFSSVTQNIFPEQEEKGEQKTTLPDFDTFYALGPRKILMHPIDAVIAIFICASPFLQAILAKKFFECQLSIPLIVPDANLNTLTTYVGALRSIISPTSAGHETSLTGQECYIVAMGSIGSDLPNTANILNIAVQKAARIGHKMFHNTQKQQSAFEGMVDMAWYLPSHKEDAGANILKDVTIFLNLRGDIQQSSLQWDVLKKNSSMTIILISGESLAKMCSNADDERSLEKLLKSDSSKTGLIIYDVNKCLMENLNVKLKLASWQKQRKAVVAFADGDGAEDSEAPKIVLDIISRSDINKTCIAEFQKKSEEWKRGNKYAFRFKTDEQIQEWQIGRQLTGRLIDCIGVNSTTTLKTVKLRAIPVQMLWREWVILNKERNRDIGKATADINHFHDTVEMKMRNIKERQRAQCNENMSVLMKEFLRQMSDYHNGKITKQSFLFMMIDFSCCLNYVFVGLSPNKYKAYRHAWYSLQELKSRASIDRAPDFEEQVRNLEKACHEAKKNIIDSSLGIEHVMREMGQIYEVMCDTREKQPHIACLPAVMADLLLSGQTIELLDGDAGHVAVNWVTSVLNAVGEKVGVNKKIVVVSILGVQSSGKSTLLNAMFGLQYAVSAGRCTRGVYGQLIPACKEETPEIDYIFVLDTEGLRAPELGRDAYLHDHEIATFVIGLADLTIINIKGELALEMQDVLQIVVHSFLRISQAKSKLSLEGSCIFVHQNVSAVNAEERNFYSRQKLQETLDEMAIAAAGQEGVIDVCKFDDIIKFDLKQHVLYFADLWLGDPPMASVNLGYSRDVQKLKKLVLNNINRSGSQGVSMPVIAEKLQDLWDSILQENFIFSFKNHLEVRAYTKLEAVLSNIRWKFQDKALELLNSGRNEVKSSDFNGLDNLKAVKMAKILTELSKFQELEMMELDTFFVSSNDRDILEQWKQNSRNICYNEMKCIKLKVEEDLIKSVSMQREDIRQEDSIKEYKKEILKEAKKLAIELQGTQLTEDLVDSKFDIMWEKCLSGINQNLPKINSNNVFREVQQLVYDLFRTNYFSLKDLQLPQKTAADLEFDSIEIDRKVIAKSQWMSIVKSKLIFNKISSIEATKIIVRSMNKLFQEVMKEMKKYEGSYFEINYAREILLYFINGMHEHFKAHSDMFSLKKVFIMKMTVYLASCLVPQFKNIHDEHRKRNDLRLRLQDRYYNQFLTLFRNMYTQTIDDVSTGNAFAQCLLPKIKEAVACEMPRLLADNVISKLPFFHTKKQFEKQVLAELLIRDEFEWFFSYIDNARKCLKGTIRHMVNKELFPRDTESRYSHIEIDKIKPIISHILGSFISVQNDNPSNISEFVDKMELKLKTCLPIPPGTFFSIKRMVVKDVSVFTGSLKKCLHSMEEQLVAEANKKTRKDARKVIGSACDLLFEKCIGCCEQCPFCNLQCSLTIPGHEVLHSITQHSCQGLSGYIHDDSDEDDHEKLVIENCSTDVASSANFRNADTLREWHPYKKYKIIYPKWDIPPDTSIETSAYWKYIFSRFSKQFADAYKAKAPLIPESWHEITIAEAIASLDK